MRQRITDVLSITCHTQRVLVSSRHGTFISFFHALGKLHSAPNYIQTNGAVEKPLTCFMFEDTGFKSRIRPAVLIQFLRWFSQSEQVIPLIPKSYLQVDEDRLTLTLILIHHSKFYLLCCITYVVRKLS